MSASLGPALPPDVVTALRQRSEIRDQALILVTVDGTGYPRLALLSRSEIEVADPGRLIVALWPTSESAANFGARGQATLFYLHAGVSYSIRLACAVPVPLHLADGSSLLAFDSTVADVLSDEAAYAAMTGAMTFELRDPDAVLPRWQELSERLADLAGGSAGSDISGM
jgi:hypothetical protein